MLWSLMSVFSYVSFVVCIILPDPAWGYCRKRCVKRETAPLSFNLNDNNFIAMRAVCWLGRLVEIHNKSRLVENKFCTNFILGRLLQRWE